MALIECPECSAKISDSAATCPHCGFATVKARQPIRPVFRLLLGVIFVLLIGALLYDTLTPKAAKEVSKPAIQIGGTYKTNGNWPDAASPDALRLALNLFDKDREAFLKLCAEGRAGILAPGVHVRCEDFSGVGMVKVRPEGETDGVWTVIEAIEPL